MATSRTWWKAAKANLKASSTVRAAGDLITTLDGDALVGDGSTPDALLLKSLKGDDLPPLCPYAYAIADQFGRVAFGIYPDGTVEVSKLAALQGALSMVSTITDPSTPYVWTIQDTIGRVALGVRADGSVDVKANLATGSVHTTALGSDVTQGLAQSLSSDSLLYGVVDVNSRASELVVGTDGNVPQWALNRWLSRFDAPTLGALLAPAVTVLTVKQDGTGDYTTIGAAVTAANAAASQYKPYRVLVHRGSYSESGLTPSAYVQVCGTSREEVRVVGYLPANSTDALMAATSTFNQTYTGQIANMAITAQNMRYAIHSEAGGLNPDQALQCANLHLEHLGNQEVIDWRTANGAPPGGPSDTAASVWSSWIPFGHGGASGQSLTFDRVTFRGRGSYYVHNNADFAKPMSVRLTGCRLAAWDGTGAFAQSVLSLSSTGSGMADEWTLIGCEIDHTTIKHTENPWLSVVATQQRSTHRDFALTLENCSPVGYIDATSSKALRITSASVGATSTVRVSGTAADAVFGVAGRPTYRDGGGGLQGYVWGCWDISGQQVGPGTPVTVNNTIGKLLGDCSGTSKTLTVTVDGGTPVNIVFSTDQRALANATIIATINTALGAAATAAEYLPGPSGEYYPSMPDRTVELVNSGTAGIPRYGAVKYGSTKRSIQLCATSDTAAVFLGVALEPIPPGKTGRVLVDGIVRYDQLYGYSGGISGGTAIGLSGATAGAFTASSTNQVATGCDTDFARFKGAR